MTSDLHGLLRRGLAELALGLSVEAQQKLLDYVSLLAKWNRVYNLTAIRDPADMVVKHLLDSLAVAPYLHGENIVDVGSGPGLPGIPLAVANPTLRFTLIDSATKKTRFMTQAVAELGLANVEVIHTRVEEYRPATPFNTVLSRAFASLHDMLNGTAHLCAEGGAFLAMKGAYPEAELREVPPGFHVSDVIRLQVPLLDGERHLLIVIKDRTAQP